MEGRSASACCVGEREKHQTPPAVFRLCGGGPKPEERRPDEQMRNLMGRIFRLSSSRIPKQKKDTLTTILEIARRRKSLHSYFLHSIDIVGCVVDIFCRVLAGG